MDSLNKLIFDKEPILQEEHLLLSHTVLRDEAILKKYRDKYVLVDSLAPNPIEIVENYGYKKVVSLIELMVLHPDVC